MHQRLQASTISIAALLVLAAGCSSDDNQSSATTSGVTTPAATTPATTTPATTTPPTTPPTTKPATTVPSTTMPGDGAYCLLRREIDTFGDSVDESQLADPELARQFFQHQLTLVEQSATVAPPELSDDIALYIAATNGIVAELESNDFNILTADLSAFDTAENDAARRRLRDYDTDVCGIPDDPEESSEDSSAFDLGSGPIVDQFVAELVAAGFSEDEARCIFGELDFTDPRGLTDSALVAAFDACGIDEARLIEIGA